MKKLITLFAGVILAASLATGAFAQAAGPTGGGVPSGADQQKGVRDGKGKGLMGGKLFKQLDLTKEQQKQVRELTLKFAEKRKAAQGAGKPDRQQAMAMRKEFMESIEKILTPVQREKLKALQAEGKDKLKERTKPGKKGGGTTGAGSTGGGGLKG